MRTLPTLPILAVPALLLTASLLACGSRSPEPPISEGPAPEATTTAVTPPPVEVAAFDAAQVYSTVCVTCHGTAGAGDGIAGLALDPKPANFTDPAFWTDRVDADLAKVIKDGGIASGKSALMAPYGGMYNDEQILELVTHLRTFKPAAEGDAPE